jgi:hypothetical protein
MESILVSIRAGLGIQQDYDGFDDEIIMAINSAIMSLNQLNVGPEAGFSVTGIDETWADLIDTATDIAGVKSYILLKTRLEFDPPSTSFAIGAIERQIKELEWRLFVQVDPDLVTE